MSPDAARIDGLSRMRCLVHCASPAGHGHGHDRLPRSATKSEEPPRSVDAEAMERALALWSGYCRPHAQAFFQRAVPTDLECQASRVVRWLRAHGAVSVSRTEVRRLALGRTVDTRGAERVMARLVDAGALRAIANDSPARGRPELRWHVNPVLAAKQA